MSFLHLAGKWNHFEDLSFLFYLSLMLHQSKKISENNIEKPWKLLACHHHIIIPFPTPSKSSKWNSGFNSESPFHQFFKQWIYFSLLDPFVPLVFPSFQKDSSPCIWYQKATFQPQIWKVIRYSRKFTWVKIHPHVTSFNQTKVQGGEHQQHST